MKGISLRSTGSRRFRGLATAALLASTIGGVAVVGTGSPAGASNTTGVTSNSITIGATVPLTGPAAPGYDEIAPAMQAVFNWVNAHGGVYGRKIHYTYLDDQYDPANTATLTRQLVLQDGIFADVGSLGTPTQSAVQKYLNAEKVPQLFVESGCNCWTNSAYPYTFGWEPPYTVEGKILGLYIKQHFAGEKVGFLYQDDEFGQDFVKGLKQEIPSSDIVSQQSYDAATLSGPLLTQMSALQSAGAKVVAMATIPAATALAMLPAAVIGYNPQYVLSNVGSDSPTVAPLLSSFTQKGGGTAAQATSAVGLLNNVITDSYIPFEGDSSNAWIKVSEKLLKDYAPSVWSKYGLDGNTEYGIALAYTFVQALQAAGKNLTRSGLVAAIAKDGKSFVTPGLSPSAYSNSSHWAWVGYEVIKLSTSVPPVVTPNGSFPGATTVSPVYVTSPGKGPVKRYTGGELPPPAKLVRTA